MSNILYDPTYPLYRSSLVISLALGLFSETLPSYDGPLCSTERPWKEVLWSQPKFKGIQIECPVWSHVRKANSRQADGTAKSLIFWRGYLFTDGGIYGRFNSGLLFICFQRNIQNAFENIKKISECLFLLHYQDPKLDFCI